MRVALAVMALLCCIAVAHSATYFVRATGGSDSNSCAQATDFGSAKATIDGVNGGTSCLASGDTLRIAGGTYPENIRDTRIPSGTPNYNPATTIEGLEGEAVIITGDGSASHIVVIGSSSRNDIILRNVIIDGAGLPDTSCLSPMQIQQTGTRIALHDSEIRNAPKASGLTIWQGSLSVWIKGNSFHDLFGPGDAGCSTSGTTGAHGIYGRGSSMIIEENHVYNTSGEGIQIFRTGTGAIVNPVVRRNRVHNVAKTAYIIGFRVQGGRWEQNVAYDNGRGMKVDGNGVQVFNNTFYQHTTALEASGQNHEIRNNILYLGAIDYGGQTESNNFITDPSFTNAAARDLTLQPTSPAKGFGLPVGLPCNGGCEAGAYEIWEHVSSSIGGVNDTTVEMSFESAYAPFRAPDNCAGWTLLGSTCGASCSAVQPQVGNLIRMVVSCAPLNTDTLTVQYTGTTVTDRGNAPVGGTYQPLHSVTFPVTNNIGGGPTPPPPGGIVPHILRSGTIRAGTQR